MKKTKLLVLTLVTCLFASILTGCGNSKQVITETAETFLQAIVNADSATIYDICTDDIIAYHELDSLDIVAMEELFYESMGVEKDVLNADAQAAVTEFCQTTIDKTFTDYSIVSVNVKKQVGTVHASITGVSSDPDEILGSDEIAEQMDVLMTAYVDTNMDSLLAIYEESGEEAMTNQVYNDLIPQMLEIMSDAWDSVEYEEQVIIFYVKKIDDKWYITNSAE